MNNILFVNACARHESRTKRLACAVLEKLNGDVTEIDLFAEDLRPLDEEGLRRREELLERKEFDDPAFRYARMVAEADMIVIAAPYWDLSFPSVLKVFIEAVSVAGITFTYSEQGYPVGYCKAEKLTYVTTSGGPIGDNDFGFEYVEAVFRGMYGIREMQAVRLEDLDIIGNDPEEMLAAAIEKVRI